MSFVDLNTTARNSDATTACNRNAEAAACGARHLISDALPKPVVVDNAGRVAALPAWDAFGDVTGWASARDTPHPYANGDGRYLYSFYPGNSGRTTPTGTALDYRFTFDMVDTEGTAATPIDGVVVQTNYVAQGTKVGGYHRGRVTTPWYTSDGGVVTLLFTSDGRNCPPNQCLDGGSPTDGGAFPYAGVGTALVEFRRRQSTATAFSVPLRFPGQYFDAETEVVENWNRFYEPATGRYLSPEPMLQDPRFLSLVVAAGSVALRYSYAQNSPLTNTDSTGLFSVSGDCPNWDKALEQVWNKLGCGLQSSTCNRCDARLTQCGVSKASVCSLLEPGSGMTAFISAPPKPYDWAHGAYIPFSFGGENGGSGGFRGAIFVNPDTNGAGSSFAAQFTPLKGGVRRPGFQIGQYSADTRQCFGYTMVAALADTILHETFHATEEFTSRLLGHGGLCGAEALASECLR